DLEETQFVREGTAATALSLREARGWPAVVGLAAVASVPPPHPEEPVATKLYEFFADEIFSKAPSETQELLLRLALLTRLDRHVVDEALASADATRRVVGT